MRRAGFIGYHFWATRYKPFEIYAAGDYPNQSTKDKVLPEFVSDNELENTDVVVWFTLGVTHIPCPEKWAVMLVSKTSFKIVPAFFRSKSGFENCKINIVLPR